MVPYRLRHRLRPLLCAGLALLWALAQGAGVQAQSGVILPSSDLGRCLDIRMTRLETGARMQRRSVPGVAPEMLRSFLPDAARRLQASGEYEPWEIGWMHEPDRVRMKVMEPVRLDVVEGGDGLRLAVLRMTNTSATCGAANCTTPSFVAAGCGGDPVACLLDGLESGRTRLLIGSELLITELAGASYVQAARCGCSGMACYRTLELWRYDTRRGQFHQDGAQRWYLSAPFLD